MRLDPNEKSAFEALWQLVILADIKLTQTSLKNALLQHNDFPTFASFGDVLDEFNIPNLSTRLATENLSEIPLPALAHLKDNNGDSFVVIRNITPNQIEWQQDYKTVQENITEFTKKWGGITLLIEPDANSGESNYEKNSKKEFIENLRTPFIITGLLICLLFLINPIIENHPLLQNWQFYGLIVSKSFGSILSVMLVWYSLDANNSFLNKICQLSKKTNCQNILSSEAANIGGIISWSEVGLIYFLGDLLSLLFFQKNPLPLLQIISLFALPYTFWSIYHQAFVAKIWCPLCLGVQALLWAEFIISLPISIKPLPFDNYDNYLELGICFLFVATILIFIKKPITKSFQAENLNIELQKLKFNPDFVQSILLKETFLPPFDYQMQMIEMGNFEAETVFQIVINPICGACRQKYLDIMEIVENNDEVKYQLILSSSPKQDEISNQVVKTILGLANNSLMIEALYKWFLNENPNVEVWKNTIKTTEDNIKGENQRLLHRQWLDEANITHVPVTYLNNVEIPTMYKAKETIKLLKYYANIGFRNQQ
jgi:uncharacterized membrane protein